MSSAAVRIRAYLLCNSPLSFGMHDLVDRVDGMMKSGQDYQRNHPDHKAFKGVEHAVSQFRLDVGDDSGDGDAARIGHNRDRNSSHKQKYSKPVLSLEKVPIHQRQEREGEQGADTAASLDHR